MVLLTAIVFNVEVLNYMATDDQLIYRQTGFGQLGMVDAVSSWGIGLTADILFWGGGGRGQKNIT